MLGVLLLRLRVVRGGHYSIFPGKLLHGAFFRYLSAYDAAIADALHARAVKPFTIGFLRRRAQQDKAVPRVQDLNEAHYATGEEVLLRVTVLDEAALAAFIHIPQGMQLEVGRLCFAVEEVVADGRGGTGIVAAEELMAAAFSMEEVMRLRFSFRSPTVFHVDDYDCAVPRPDLIFASLSDKWTAQGLPVAMDKSYVRAAASRLIPYEWRGAGLRIRQGGRRTIPGYVGAFTFDMAQLSLEEREIIVLLAQFAPFSGTGRLTAQGMGETTVTFL